MPALDPIDDANTFPDKDDGGTAQTTGTVNADDLNSIKSRISENRTQANAALAAAENAQTAADDAQGTADDALRGIAGAVPTAHTASTKTIASTDSGSVIRLDPSSNAIAVTIPHTLFGSIVANRSFRFRMVALNVTNAITLAGSGGLSLTYYGDSTITAGDVIDVVVESATVARVEVIKTGAALPAPGGTTTANGIVTGSGTTGSAVAVSTTTIADLAKRLGNVFTLNASTVLDDSYSGGIVFVDTSGGARTLTIPPTVGSGWNAIIVREGANALNVVGSTVGADTMLMAGPAAAANAVAIAVDNGGVSVIRRSAVKCWCAGVIA